MYILIILYILLLLVEGLLGLGPIVEFGDFSLSYHLLLLMMINIVSLLRFVVKPNLIPIYNEIFMYYVGIVLTFIPVLIFHSHLAMGGLSLMLQFMLQSLLILILSKTFGSKSVVRFLQFLIIFAFVNCATVYGSYFFPDAFRGIAEVHGYFGYNTSDPDRIIRAFGIMGDAAPWFLSFFSVLYLYLRKYLISIFYGLTCILGASLGATALLIMAVLLFFFLKSENKFRFIFRFFSLISLVMLVVFAIKPELFLDISVVKRITDPAMYKSASGAQRLYTYGLGINMIIQSPFWGSGYGTFLYNLKSSLGNEFFNLKFGNGALSNANNQFLQVLYEGGIILFILFVFMVRRILLIFVKYANWDQLQDKMIEFKKAAFVWFLALVLMNQTAVWMVPSMLWLLVVSLIGISIYVNKNIKFYEGNSPDSHH